MKWPHKNGFDIHFYTIWGNWNSFAILFLKSTHPFGNLVLKKRDYVGNALLKLFPLTGSIEISLPYDSSMNWSAVKQSLEYLCTFRTMENKAFNILRPNNMSYSHGQRRRNCNRSNFHTFRVSPFLTMTVCFQWFWIWKSNGYSNKVVRLKWLVQFSIHVRRKLQI